MSDENYRAQLEEMFIRLNISFDSDQEDLLIEHLHLLMAKNKELNLTSITNMEDALIYHVEDSLLAFEDFKQSQPQYFCDLGTGGGFPGIPLAIMSDGKGLLIDSIKKKTTAVKGFIEKLGLEDNLDVRAIRAEELAIEDKYHFDMVVTRAVSALPSLLELASPLLDVHGRLLVLKGDPAEAEISAGKATAEIVGMELIEDSKKTIGPDNATRRILLYEKAHMPAIQLPRRNGMAQKKPLVRYK